MRAKGRGYKSDIVMASWFPMKVIRRLQNARFDDMMVEYRPSFSGLDMASWNDAPELDVSRRYSQQEQFFLETCMTMLY